MGSGGVCGSGLWGGALREGVLWIVVVYVVADYRGGAVGDDVLWIVVVYVVAGCRKGVCG